MAIMVGVWVVGCDAGTKKPDRDWPGCCVFPDCGAVLGRRFGGAVRWGIFCHSEGGGMFPAG